MAIFAPKGLSSAEGVMQYQAGTIAGAIQTADAPSTGLTALADRVSECRMRVQQVAGSLNMVALGIHGPRPEPVQDKPTGANSSSDSLRARIDDLSGEIAMLEDALRSLVR